MMFKRFFLFVLVCGIVLGLPNLFSIPVKIASAQETGCKILGTEDIVSSLVFSPDGSILATEGIGSIGIKLWDVARAKVLKTLGEDTCGWSSVVFSPDGLLLASSGSNAIKIWEVASGKIIKTIKGELPAFSPDGTFLASSSSDPFSSRFLIDYDSFLSMSLKMVERKSKDTINLWEFASGKLIRTFKRHKSSVSSLAFSPDGKIIASGSYDNTIKLWQVDSGELIRTLEGHKKEVHSVAFSPDGSILVSGSRDKSVKLWQVSSGKLVRTLEGQEGINSVSLSPDGKIIATGGVDNTIQLWQASNGKLIQTLKGHKNVVSSVTFSPDGSILASGSYDRTIRLWDMNFLGISFKVPVDVDSVPEGAITNLSADGIAVVIGIEEYKHAPKASYATRDAQVFYEYAKTVFGIPERNIYIRTNEDATKGEFEKIFEPRGWLARRIKPDKSQVLVFISCHGAPDFETREPYLVPYDVDPNYAQTMGYALKRIYKNLGTLGAESVIVFIDACFSGMSREKEMLLAEAKGITIMPRIPKVGKGVVVFSGAKGDQTSSGYKEKKHGLFTYYLLKGLQGTADKNKDKAITFEELVRYVKAQVSETAVYLDREQTPTLLPALEKLDEAAKKRIIVRYK